MLLNGAFIAPYWHCECDGLTKGGMLEEDAVGTVDEIDCTDECIEEDRSYCVYVHINKINGKKYVGMTKQQPPEKRWGINGSKYYNSAHFYSAINKYGWDNFEHKVIKKNLTIDEANQLESKLIKEFDTMNGDKGYNLKGGGDAPIHSKSSKEKMSNTWKSKFKSVAQYDKNFNLIKIWEHASDAAKKYGVKSFIIYNCCNGKRKTSKGYIWRYADEPITSDYINWINWRPVKLRIVQLSQDKNEIVKMWTRTTRISEDLNISLYDIYLCLEGKREAAGGYVWKYYRDVKNELENMPLNSN